MRLLPLPPMDPAFKRMKVGVVMRVHVALVLCRLQPDGGYKTLVDGLLVSIHPSSVLAGKKPECVVYNELVRDLSVCARLYVCGELSSIVLGL